jgi:branched-chain amino acid transport system permease protein
MAVTRYCVRTYSQDRKVFSGPLARFSLGVLAVLLVSFPFWGGTYWVHVACVCGVSVVTALGLNLLTGYTGLISLGHAAFMGIGAYTAAVLAIKANFPFLVTLPMAGIMAAAAGAVVGIPTLRLKGLYLVVTTLAFQFIVEHVIFHWESVTNADTGLDLPFATLPFITFDSKEKFYYVILVIAVLTAVFTKNMAMSRTGRAFVAIRDRDIAAEIIGIPLARYKILSFIISAFIAGVAGALYAYLVGHIGPDLYTFEKSIRYVAMIIVGGMATVLGSILGAFFITLLPVGISEIFGPLASQYPALATRIGAVNVTVYGLVIVLFLLFEPDGLFGIWIRIKRYFTQWPFTY